MSIIGNYRKNKAIKSYIVKLPKILSKDYGKSEFYTPEQVSKSIERSGLQTIYAYFAVSMFCIRESYDSYYQTPGQAVSYDDSRTEIADGYFNSYTDFSPKHIDAISEDYNSNASFDSLADGGDFGGDGGGGDG